MFHVEVVYCPSPHQQWSKELVLSGVLTLGQVIQRSGVLEAFALQLQQHKVGVWGIIKPLDTKVKEGDRVEIYRPLKVSPMEARRRRAQLARDGRR